MLRRLSVIGTWLTKIESWLALIGMVAGTGAFVWLGQQWDVLAAQGWAAVTIIAALCASAAIGALSLGYLALSRVRGSRSVALDPARTPSQRRDSVEITADESGGHETPSIKVRGRAFSNEIVPLDGHSYIGCTFTNVTFLYNGGDTELARNDIISSFMLRSNERKVEAAWFMAHKLGLLNAPLLEAGKEIDAGVRVMPSSEAG